MFYTLKITSCNSVSCSRLFCFVFVIFGITPPPPPISLPPTHGYIKLIPISTMLDI